MIQKLIAKGYKAIIVECGHGALISNAFLSAKSASKLVIVCKQPYSKEEQAIEYPDAQGMRSVSKEYIQTVIKTEITKYQEVYADTPLLCIATSFQLGDENTIAHGYIGVGYPLRSGISYKIFHFTFYKDDLTKTEWINTIQGELMNLLNNLFNGDTNTFNNLDGVWECDGDEPLIANIEKVL